MYDANSVTENGPLYCSDPNSLDLCGPHSYDLAYAKPLNNDNKPGMRKGSCDGW